MNHLLGMLDQQLSLGQQDIAILVKGSRSAHMEHVVTEIMHWFEQMNSQQSTSEESCANENNASNNQASENQSKEGKA